MSRRSSSAKVSSKNSTDDRTAANGSTAVAEPSSAPSLESLLKSCGALQKAIRQNQDEAHSSEFVHDIELAHSDETEVTHLQTVSDAKSCATNSENIAGLGSVQFNEAENTTSECCAQLSENVANSLNIVSILKLMREEIRGSIEELRASQEAAAAGQSAVLKALFEVVSRSSSVRDDSSDVMEAKLSEFEERLMSRIEQSTNSATTKPESKLESGDQTKSLPSLAPSKNDGRTWAQIRSDLLLHGDSRASGGEVEISEVLHAKGLGPIDDSTTGDKCGILEVPRAVNPDLLSDNELRQAFFEREEFISTLIGRLRQAHHQSSGHLPAEKLKAMAEHLPEELAAQVMQTLQQLDELARMGELELSLERARLSRQVSKLDDSRQLLEHHARQMGLKLTDDGNVSNPQKSVNRGSGSRRWLSKLGFGQ